MIRLTLPAALLSLAFAASAFAAPPSFDMSSFHAKMTTTTTGGPKGQNVTMNGELWASGKKMRMDMSGPMGNVSNLVADGFAFMWQTGQKQGMKTKINPANVGSSLIGANDCLKTATSAGAETIEGVATEKWTYKDCGGQKGFETTLWLAKGKGWPKRMEVKGPQGTVTTTYRDVETAAKISPSLLTPPKDVVFQDMEEIMKKMQQGSGAPGHGSPHPPMK